VTATYLSHLLITCIAQSLPCRQVPPTSSAFCTMSKQPNLYSFPNVDTVATHLRTYVLQCQKAAFERHEKFKIAVSGGSLPATLSKALLAPDNGTQDDKPQFSKWEIFFADERAVPLDHDDSNYGLLRKDLLDHIPPSSGTPQVFPIDVKVLDDTQEIADKYQEELMASFASKDSVKLPIFDLILLGCGPDGHTCSLFPGHDLLREHDAWVAAIEDSPKPPPRRITLSLPVVTHAIKIAFVATGGGKKEILKKILETEEGRSLPCGLVNEGGGEKVSWFADAAATEGVSFPKRGNL
jgi:6-phosphogluconolactonase